MIIQPDFLTHWKVQALSGIIGRAEALTALLALWGHCQNSKTYVFEFTLPMLAGICQYQGDAAVLHRAMLDCRLLDPLDGGRFEVHGWAEKNASYTAAWSNGAKNGARKNPPVPPNAPPVHPSDAHGLPIGPPSTGISEPTGPPKEGRNEGMKEENEGTAPGGDGFRPVRISWSPDEGWTGFTPELRHTLEKSFPGIDIDLACNETDLWLRDPRNASKARKKNWFSFLTNWLRRSSPSPAMAGKAEAKSAEKNEGGPPPSFSRFEAAPAGPWAGAFEATYGRPPESGWDSLPPGIQREIRGILAAADPLTLGSYQTLEKLERGAAA